MTAKSPPPDVSQEPLSSEELAREARDKGQPVLRPSDAPGHTLPASEEGMAEPEGGEGVEADIARTPPD